MGNSKKDICGGICYLLSAGFLLILLLLIFLNDDFLKWADAHSGAASWAQAIFGLFAIFAAFVIAYYQISKNNKSNEESKLIIAKSVRRIILGKISDDLRVIKAFKETLNKTKIDDEGLSDVYKLTIFHTAEIVWPDSDLLMHLASFGEEYLDAVVTPYEQISSLNRHLSLNESIIQKSQGDEAGIRGYMLGSINVTKQRLNGEIYDSFLNAVELITRKSIG